MERGAAVILRAVAALLLLAGCAGRRPSASDDAPLPREASKHGGGGQKTVERLVDAGADVNARNAQGRTALHVAANEGREGLVRYLLTRGAAPNLQDADGNTALHLAAAGGHDGCTRSLKAVSDWSIRNARGLTAYDIADITKTRPLLTSPGAP